MLPRPRLNTALLNIPSRPLFNRVYGRTIWYRYRNDFLGKHKTTVGANRFNEHNGARVLYLAQDYETALREVQALGSAVLSTRIVFPVTVDLKAVIDLCDPDVQNQLGTNTTEIRANFRRITPPVPTQDLGEECNLLGDIDGILYPSAIDQNWVNLAVFEAALGHLGSSVWIEDPANGLSAASDPDLRIP